MSSPLIEADVRLKPAAEAETTLDPPLLEENVERMIRASAVTGVANFAINARAGPTKRATNAAGRDLSVTPAVGRFVTSSVALIADQLTRAQSSVTVRLFTGMLTVSFESTVLDEMVVQYSRLPPVEAS